MTRGFNESDIGIGYTIATGRLFCSMKDFQSYAELVLQRPVYTHEFGEQEVWEQLRAEYEKQALGMVL